LGFDFISPVTADGNPESIQTPHPRKAVKDNSRQAAVKKTNKLKTPSPISKKGK